jgi:membrane protein required for colicin V production
MYDILMLIVLGGAIFFGYWKGLAWQVASLASIIVSYIVASNFHGFVSPYFSMGEPWDKFAAMLVLFLGTSLLVWIGFGYIRNTIEDMKLKGFDHQVGAVLGAFKGGLLCMVITLFAVTLLPNSLQQNVIGSRSGHFIARSINQLSMVVPDEIHAVIDGRLQDFNQQFVNNNLDPTAPLTLDNKDTWFGEPQINNQDPLNSGGQVFQGQAQTNDFNLKEELIKRGIEQGIESIGRGINGNQNR